MVGRGVVERASNTINIGFLLESGREGRVGRGSFLPGTPKR